MAKDLAVKEEFIRLRAEGLSFSKIANQLGVSRPTLIKWSGELQSQISAARYAQLEALAEQYGLLKEARIKAFGQLLEKLMAELKQRELAEIPTYSKVTGARRSDLADACQA